MVGVRGQFRVGRGRGRGGRGRGGRPQSASRQKPWEKELAQINEKKALYSLELDGGATFADYPLSAQTQRGLRRYLPESEAATPTLIQRATLLPALRSRDILAAAKTGSGKTLAFLVPLLERLWTERWTNQDGPGAVVLSPTRELAMQTYDVLKTIGIRHPFSAGLIIGGQTGGKNFKEESLSIGRLNIIIATPGRLCQHLAETPLFDLDKVLVFVLDEADRMLDMGFKTQIDRIVGYLPKGRQTLLFSATQTTSIKDLARLSLRDPVYVNTSSNSRLATPAKLKQTYCIVKGHEKLNFLYSFIKNVAIREKTKTIVFIATCKQVMHIKEVFFKMKPGLPMMTLHSKMGQHQRLATYDEFCRKERALLIATDLCARGMDFPGIDWVVQLDCPETPDEYIHRAGRTARNNSTGNCVLCLTPSEKEGMLGALQSRNPPVQLTSWSFNRKKMTDLTPKLRAFCAESEEVRGYAQRAFVAYCKCVYLARDKKTFNIAEYKLDKYAGSLGLAKSPRLRFLERDRKVMSSMKEKIVNSSDESDGEDMFERREAKIADEEVAMPEKAKPKKNKDIVKGDIKDRDDAKKRHKHMTFDEEGNTVKDESENEEEDDFNIEDASARLRQADMEHDRQKEKETKKEKRLAKKRKEREKKKAILESRKPKAESDDEDEKAEEDGGLLPETQDFLNNLTVAGGSDTDSVDYDKLNASSDEETKPKRARIEHLEDVDDEDEDDDEEEEDLAKLEAMAMAHL